MKVKAAQLSLTLWDPMDYIVHRILLARILEWVAFPFSRGPNPGSNPGFPHCGLILYQLSHKGSPKILEWVAYPFSRGSSQPRNRTRVSCIAGEFFTNWATIFPAVSVNKDVTIISDFSLPNVKFWTVRAPRKERNTYPPGDIRLQPLPTVSTEELGMWKNPGYWPQIAEMHMKEMISVSPDSCIFAYTEKH